jgi:AcrR family transcriptional regulator
MAAALLDAAKRMIESGGIGALTLREVARRADTTTRAVYSVFGSKEALLGALGARSFELLTEGLRAIVVANRRPRQPTRRSLPYQSAGLGGVGFPRNLG